jgi:uncharacterized protein YndB with AHSA1/START domain
MTTTVPDRIEKQVLLRAPLARVWKALTDYQEFGRWFGVRFDAPFAVGAIVPGVITGTEVDAGVAAVQDPYVGMPFEITVDRVEPMRQFSFRWHPYSHEPGVDYSREVATLVVFTLDERPDGVLLRVVESGFDKVPLERRAKAFTANDAGWAMQMTLIEKYLARQA